MNPSPAMLDELLEIAIHAATAASTLLAGYVGQPLDVEHKAGQSEATQVVTRADRESRTLLAAQLPRRFHDVDIGFLGEEAPDDGSRFNAPFFWCVDPLDGTLPFVRGEDGFSVSVALIRLDGTPLLGVVADPVAKRLFAARRGGPATLNGQPLLVKSGGQALTLFVDRSMVTHSLYKDALAGVKKLASARGLVGVKVVSHCGACVNATGVLLEGPALYFKFARKADSGGSIWDYGATAALFNACGCPVSDLFGQPLELNRRVSTHLNHRGFIYASDEVLANKVKSLVGTLVPSMA